MQIDLFSDEPVPDQDTFVPLPDLNEEKSDDYYYGADSTLIHNDDGKLVETSTDASLVKDETPFYANQMEDPEVYAAFIESLYGDE